MEPYASILDYEKERRRAEQEFNLGFQPWKDRSQRHKKGLNLLALNLFEHLHTDEDIQQLADLCLAFLIRDIIAFALLLRQVAQDQVSADLESHAKAVLEKSYEYKWCYGLIQHYYFMERMDGDFVTKHWSFVNNAVLYEMRRYWCALWSSRDGFEEPAPNKFSDAFSQGHKRYNQKVDQEFAEKRRRNQKRKTRPNSDEKIIIAAINDGLHGVGFCKQPDIADPPVKPRSSWMDSQGIIPKWPGSYVKAYTTGLIPVKKMWKKKIQDYKSDIRTKIPDQIKQKTNRKNSPTRHDGRQLHFPGVGKCN
jgi:hypothetical protein